MFSGGWIFCLFFCFSFFFFLNFMNVVLLLYFKSIVNYAQINIHNSNDIAEYIVFVSFLGYRAFASIFAAANRRRRDTRLR